MPTSISIGFSQDHNPHEAVLQACIQVKNELNTADTDLIIVFASAQYIIAETQAIITRSLKPKYLIGSSTNGIILNKGVANRGIAIVGINSDEINFGVSAITNLDTQDLHYTGFDLARKATQSLNSSHREAFITFSEGMEKNSSSLIRGVKEVLGGAFPFLGAISCDDFKNKKIAQFFQDQILHGSVVGLLVGGSCHISLSCKHGFKPLGKPRTVTKVDGCTLHTIDDRPAIEIYQHFLGPKAKELKNTALNSYTAQYPLGFYLEDSRQYLLRNIIDILPDGSIVCHEGIPQGAEVHLMISSKESCQSTAIEAAKSIKASLNDRTAKLVLIFESLSRHRIMGRSASGEIQAIKDVLGKTTPIIGMCSNGELGPFDSLNNAKKTYMHNQNILMMAIS